MMKASTSTIKSAITGFTQGWPMGTTISSAASHICMSVGIVFITKLYRPARKEAILFLRGTHDRADAGSAASHTGNKRGDLPTRVSSDDRRERRVGFSPILAMDYKSCPSADNLRRNRESIYWRAYESSQYTRREPDGAVLFIIAAILIFVFGF